MAGNLDKEVLNIVLERFPQWALVIKRLSIENDQFTELCSDYADCLSVLENLLQRGDAGKEIEQYCELRIHLEQELRDLFSRSKRENPQPKKSLNQQT